MKKKSIPAKTITRKKRIQKKRKKRVGAFFLFIIILGGSGYLFFKGWIQLQIPENHCAVIFSKINKSGYDERLYYPGDFVWKWEAVIPGFVTVHNFPLEKQMVTVNYKASLPSSDVYADFSELDTDFSYSISIKAVYQISENKLLEMVLKGDLTAESYSVYSNEIKNSIEESVGQALWNSIALSQNNPEAIFKEEWKVNLEDDIVARSKNVFMSDIYITYNRIPDIELYNKAKENYLALMDLKSKIRKDQISKTVAAEEANERKLMQLQKYGEIITQYPLLIQFLALKSDPEYSNLIEEIFINE